MKAERLAQHGFLILLLRLWECTLDVSFLILWASEVLSASEQMEAWAFWCWWLDDKWWVSFFVDNFDHGVGDGFDGKTRMKM
jgi:hypothetical protein